MCALRLDSYIVLKNEFPFNNKQIIILDESTSNLDNETEENILGLLKKINEIITIIFISHKKTSLVDCNKLYNINNNEIKKIK